MEFITANHACTLAAIVDPAPAAVAMARAAGVPWFGSLRDGVQNLRVTEAASEAARTGEVVRTESPT